MEVGFDEGRRGGGHVRGWINVVRADVPQDGGVDAVVKACGTPVCDGADSVVVHGLVGGENEGVALARDCID